MPRKPKTTQPEIPNKVQGRDLFETPNYATELLVPFIPKDINTIWECACGDYKITNVLKSKGYDTFSSDLKYGANFLITHYIFSPPINICIITNPPFSLKQKFFNKCIEYNLPFALLLPFDMNMWLCEAFDKYDCQALVPNRRINYITPTGLSEATGHTSYYHSMWLTRYFNLPKQLTIVELTRKEMKENI
jgi:hypothetical protein